MSTIANVNSLSTEAYLTPGVASKPSPTSTTSTNEGVPVDQVDLTHSGDPSLRLTGETGRIALNAQAGNLTSDQATQLYQQVSSIQSQIAADKQGGGSVSSQDQESIRQAESQLSASIYSDAHAGAAPPSTPPAHDAADQRATLQAGRITANEQNGNITSTQAQQLSQQQAQIDQQIASDKQANGGSLTKAQAQQINQLQDQANKQIYQDVHNTSPAAQ